MKAVILSAGQGKRLLPLTLDAPKCLLDVNGRPIIYRQLDFLAEAGVEEAVCVLGYRAEKVEEKFDMECTVIEGEGSDTVEFTRSGCNGTLTVAADHFDLHAQLGFLLGAFAKTIEAEIEKNLDALLGSAAAEPKAAAKKKKS